MIPGSLPATIPRRRAFSLVEVTLAIGIISFAVITLLGLMPVGLNTMRQASRETTESQIVREVGANALLAPPANFQDTTFFYDNDGVFLTNSPAAAPDQTRYRVTASLLPPTFPGSGNAPAGSLLTNSISLLRLQVVCAPVSSANNASTNIYTIQVPNSGR